ncbi:MAG: DDE-type integrase/transposase/recombinase [Candidatus Omnitrophica bacterium]|nr:DDE-type integrase/transposase/recombinase [Candidatus Omnitrophota bacterium]
MSRRAKWEYLCAIYARYQRASPAEKSRILDEGCQVCGYHRKYAIRLLNGPLPARPPRGRRRRPTTYSAQALSILTQVWEAAGYPWSVRLKALLPLWLPWMRQRFSLTPALERQMLAISARQIDRRLQAKTRHLKRRLYGRTKPGTLLKHHIPIKTDHWDVTQPGYAEIDLVSHSGDCADGEFVYSLTLTDIHTTWTEARAVRGKGATGIEAALEDMRRGLPFSLRGIDSDNGSEFINHPLWRYAQRSQLQFTRGRPYKKDDNAHVEQKNWTHVRRLLAWERYDTAAACAAINALYQRDLRLFMNLFQPSVKLAKKVRVGSRLTRVYDAAQTPLDRVAACPDANRLKVAALRQLRARLDPFVLAQRIDERLARIFRLATRTRRVRVSTSAQVLHPSPRPPSTTTTGLHS